MNNMIIIHKYILSKESTIKISFQKKNFILYKQQKQNETKTQIIKINSIIPSTQIHSHNFF